MTAEPVTKLKIVQDIENPIDFIKERNAKKEEFNLKITALKTEIETAQKNFKEKVLLTIPVEDVKVFLHAQICSTWFSSQPFPYNGITLQGIEILYREYIGDTGFKYWNNILVRFNFKEVGFVYNHFSFSNLKFRDKELTIIEDSAGVSFDPRFEKKEEYLSVKQALEEVQKKLKTA